MNIQNLLEFIDKEWNNDLALTAPQVGRIFGTSRGNARNYLGRLVDQGILIRIQHEYNVWYILPIHKDSFMVYKEIGVRIN